MTKSNIKKLKIYFTSDVHGYFYPTTYGDREVKPVGLFSSAAAFEKDDETLIIDGGDMLQGSAFAYYCKNVLKTPKYIAQMVNDCGYDYVTLGNHDFNYGQEYQAKYRELINAQVICQNICSSDGKTLYPYVIRQMKNGLRVGLVGITTDYINIWEKKENLKGISVNDSFEAAKTALSEMKSQADITVCVYHGGYECDLDSGKQLSNTTENLACKICRELNFDIVLTGHQHMSVDGREFGNSYTVEPAANGKEYHLIEAECLTDEKRIGDGWKLSACGSSVKISSKKLQADPSLKRAKELFAKYQFLEDKVQKWLDEPMGRLSRELRPADKVEMALHGSCIADFINRIQREASGAQISVVALANEIAGFNREVTTRDIIATYPYPNTLVVCRVSAAQLKAAMERSAEYFDIAKDGSVVVSQSFLVPKIEHYQYDYYSGVEYTICPDEPIGSRIKNIRFEGRPVTEGDSFTVCMNNYRYSGAGKYKMYPQCPVVKEINTEVVEIIMDYFRSHPYIEV